MALPSARTTSRWTEACLILQASPIPAITVLHMKEIVSNVDQIGCNRQADFSVVEAMVLASLIATNNMSVPASSYCADASCSIEAYAGALQAECITSQRWGFPTEATTTCSTFDDQLCVRLGIFAPDAYNFTTSSLTNCESRAELGEPVGCPPGDFAVLVGAWTN
jgi:hypothetical protein